MHSLVAFIINWVYIQIQCPSLPRMKINMNDIATHYIGGVASNSKPLFRDSIITIIKIL